MAVSPVMLEYANRTNQAVGRWKTSLSVPLDADDKRAASMIRSALVRAAQAAAVHRPAPCYNDDNSWAHDGIRGITRERIREEVEISRDKMAAAPEEWGIMARVRVAEAFFDVPIVIDLDESAAINIIERMGGSEARFVDVEAIGMAFPGERFEIFFHADNWGRLRELALDGILTMDEAMDFRRPVVWDLMRGMMASLPLEPLPRFSEEEFFTRFAKSSRYDVSLMESNRAMVETLAGMSFEPLSAEWGEWHPAVIDVLNTIGNPVGMDGISVILNFVVQEPTGEFDADGDPVDAWAPVGYHNVIVAYGLHPLNAQHVLDLVLRNAVAFYDLPQSDERRYLLVGASAIQDTMLSSMRVSTYGRTDAYDRIVDVPIAA